MIKCIFAFLGVMFVLTIVGLAIRENVIKDAARQEAAKPFAPGTKALLGQTTVTVLRVTPSGFVRVSVAGVEAAYEPTELRPLPESQ